MSSRYVRREALLSNGNPFLRGPCFVGPRDHRFCRGIHHKWPVQLKGDSMDPDGGPVHYVDHTFRCPCSCGHPEPPADAQPGRDMNRTKALPATMSADAGDRHSDEARPPA